MPERAGGVVCQQVGPTLTVCRVLPHVITFWDLLGGVFLLGLGIWAVGALALYLQERRHHGRWQPRPNCGPEPTIHFPRRYGEEELPGLDAWEDEPEPDLDAP